MAELQNQCHAKSEDVNKMVVNQPNSDFMSENYSAIANSWKFNRIT